MEVVKGLSGIIFGYGFYMIFSNPENYFNRILPKFEIKRVQITPNLKIRLKGYIIHIHHWISMMALFGFITYVWTDLTNLLILKTFCLGGIIQGVIYNDRFKIINKIKADN